ncbi:MAG: efflux RND transporter permease subunit [Myxococcota bacterium]
MSGEADVDPPTAEESRGVLAWWAKNTVASNILMLILIAGGLLALGQIKQEVFPEVEIETVIITVPYPGASPAEVEQGVVLAVEEAVRGIDGVKEVRGTASEGNATVAVELLTNADADRALNDVKSAVDRVTSLPEDTERPIIAMATNRRQVLTLVLYGDVDESVLHDLAEEARFDLLGLDDVTYLEITGTRPLEIAVEVPQAKLREHGLTLLEVADAIRASAVEIPGGGVKTRGGEILLRTDERRDFGVEFEDIVLRSQPNGADLTVGDVATVRDGYQETDRESYFFGKRAVRLNVFRVGDETPISVSAAVHQWLQEKQGTFPPGVETSIWGDQSESYADRVDLLRRNGTLGLALVLLVLGLFLEPRLAFWVTLGIPISFAGSLLLLPGWDLSINMISLFAFIVTLGIVVDDAIVVGEAIYERRSKGMGFLRAAITGVQEVAQPVVFSVLTTCVAFAPLLFVPGVSGKFFRNIPVVVISVLLLSLVESLMVLPAHLSHRMNWALRFLLTPLLLPLQLVYKLRADRGLAWFVERVYRPVLALALRYRYVTLSLALATLVACFGLVAGGRIQFSFLPKVEGDVITASLRMPVGTSVDDTRRLQERMVAAAYDAVEPHGGEDVLRGMLSDVGDGTGFGGGPVQSQGGSGSHLATVMMYLVPADERDVLTVDLVEDWRESIGEIAGAETLTFRYSVGADAGSPIEVQLSHPDNDVLEASAIRLAGELREYAGLRDIDSGVSPGKEQLNLTLTEEGRARGLTVTGLARQVRGAYFGSEALRQQRGREELRVYVRRPLAERVSLDDVDSLVVRTPDGGEMPLGQAANVSRGRAYTELKRLDGRRIISVTADIVQGVGNANEINGQMQEREIPALLADVPGLTFSLGGEQQEQGDSLGALAAGFGFALFGIYGLLAVAFRRYLQPLIVMSAIPFGIVGALLGHYLMGYELSIISMMGIVALSGVVVNDSLVLLVATNAYRAEGRTAAEAITMGGMRRFRPILLTSLTTFFGLAPMILETSVQARFLIPMAVSLGFGVLFATFILLLLVPSVYLILEDLQRGVGRLIRPMAEALEDDDEEEGMPEESAPPSEPSGDHPRPVIAARTTEPLGGE